MHEFKVNRKKHRSTLETDVEVLTCAKTSVCLTKLMYTCNMSFNGLKNRLEELEAKGLMAHEELGFGKNDSAKKYYCTTALGKEFLTLYFKMQNFYSNTLMVRAKN